MRRTLRYALPTTAVLGVGAAIATAAAPGPDAGIAASSTGATTQSTAVFQRGATDYLLEIDGIKGESTDNKHPGAIAVDSFDWGAESSNTRLLGAGGAGAGKVKFDGLTIKKPVDAASPVLFQRCATGQHIKKAVLFVRKAGAEQQDYLKVTLTDVVVSSYDVASQEPAGDGEVETVSLNFTKIEYSYQPQRQDGSLDSAITAGWDLTAHKAG